MKKRSMILIPFCLMIIMAMTMSSNVLAATVSGDVSYDGKELHINYSQAEFKNKLAKLLPGDEAVLSLSLSSNGKKTTVLPEIAEREWQGKTYYNWKTK